MDNYTISKLPEKYTPTKEEHTAILRNALKKLILQKPNILLGCRVADEIRQEIERKEKEKTR